MYLLKVRDHFDAAHFLSGYQGKCSRMHGHRWDVEVSIAGKNLNDLNILIDFGFVKKALKEKLDVLDHYVINEELGERRPTAEFLAKWFFEGLRLSLPFLQSVTVWESPECSVEYFPND